MRDAYMYKYGITCVFVLRVCSKLPPNTNIYNGNIEFRSVCVRVYRARVRCKQQQQKKHISATPTHKFGMRTCACSQEE